MRKVQEGGVSFCKGAVPSRSRKSIETSKLVRSFLDLDLYFLPEVLCQRHTLEC